MAKNIYLYDTRVLTQKETQRIGLIRQAFWIKHGFTVEEANRRVGLRWNVSNEHVGRMIRQRKDLLIDYDIVKIVGEKRRDLLNTEDDIRSESDLIREAYE